MALVKKKREKAVNKVDMTLDAIIKLQKTEKKKQLKVKDQTSAKNQLQQSKKLSANLTLTKSGSRLKNSAKLTKKIIPGKKQKQQPGQQKLGVQRNNTSNQFTERILKKKNKKQGNIRTFPKVKQKGNYTPRINTKKQQYSKKARENLVNSRRQLQSRQNVNLNKQRNNEQKLQPKRTGKFANNKKQNTQETQGSNRQGRIRRLRRRSFQERMYEATENASKLKVIIDNPKAKLSSTYSESTRHLMQMQLSRISAVTGNTTLSLPENTRPQRTRLSKDQLDLKLYPTKLHPLRISLNNDLVQSSSSSHQSPFNDEYRINIPVEKIIPTLNERFSSMPVDKDDFNIGLQARCVSVPIVIS